ncbi:MAG: DEAD/DEAH box helicase family protein [Alphaproteobacteria bacterium]|nr:DEAD/DEAH box helicase family protein [Alphaproteobacteria bacterium]MDA8000680.1 DEAD/DEAH box helicase family protein [Alphaproteobacteria bacterium]MDA8003948.1 DEAD/DEAH box helicase family protein [Alphaproteobacteria bacterium]MDA8004987.1 DEAD/DEAH box helicase family protein [Alphaproteobacteria bacterium]
MTGKASSPIINPGAIEPLFKPWEEPSRHRVRGAANQAKIVDTRHGSRLARINALRHEVGEWRHDMRYPGASRTSQSLLRHWFGREHIARDGDGNDIPFRYYFCQREAIETLIYLMEVKGARRLTKIVEEFSGANAEILAQGVDPEKDLWPRYAFKIATGAGKTKCMSLAVVWSYFHSIYESESPMARHFVLIAPNLTVFERLREDFYAQEGKPDIFYADPLIPPGWRGDWNMSVVSQDDAGGAHMGGKIYLTNIHRLYEPRPPKPPGTGFNFVGAPVSKDASVSFDRELRDKITEHERVMVINDEAHHVWSDELAWSKVIRRIHSKTDLVAQLDFSATPKSNSGKYFPHIVCDTPLGEAVDAGIVKTPVIGKIGGLKEKPSDDAAVKYDQHLQLGYQRWEKSLEEWRESGKYPLMFVMCSNTGEADQITRRLNTDSAFQKLNGKVINLHTNLKGRIVNKKIGGEKVPVFVENKRSISGDDLRALRDISRRVDRGDGRYLCIVSVLMLREGWDVKNVTTIVPLRPYSSQANILPEQTLGRGLRRMTPPGAATEVVVVVDHPAFASLYKDEFEQEGLLIEEQDVEDIERTTVSIFPDKAKDLDALDIEVPGLTAGYVVRALDTEISYEEVLAGLQKYKTLPIGGKVAATFNYEGKQLFTDEVIEKMEVRFDQWQNLITSINYYIKELEHVCKVRGLFNPLAPLMQKLLCEDLFGEHIAQDDSRLKARLADQDVREYIRAIFLPVIRGHTVRKQTRARLGGDMRLSEWRAFQATFSERHPAVPAAKTPFNLVTCDLGLEKRVAEFLDSAEDVAAFAKNKGPQALRIDYTSRGDRPQNYTPDFFVRATDGEYTLLETKGQEGAEAGSKARAATEWCKAASRGDTKWRYVYMPQRFLDAAKSGRFADLARACEPELQDLLKRKEGELHLQINQADESREAARFFGREVFNALSPREQDAVADAIYTCRALEKKPDAPNFKPVFATLTGAMDTACNKLVRRLLIDKLPADKTEKNDWFKVASTEKKFRHYDAVANNLKRCLLYDNAYSVIGLAKECLSHAHKDNNSPAGVFIAVKETFAFSGSEELFAKLGEVNKFRNNYIAHGDNDLSDKHETERQLHLWVATLLLLKPPA